jgi:hypothetical protein
VCRGVCPGQRAQEGTCRPDVVAAARNGQGQSVVAVSFDAPDPLPIP